MSAKAQQVTKEATTKRVQAAPAVISDARGFAGNHTLIRKQSNEQFIQRKVSNEAEPSSVPPIVGEVLRSPGQALDATTRAFMKPRFGRDFTQVRLHSGMPRVKHSMLTVGEQGDRYEQEAARIASTIARVPVLPQAPDTKSADGPDFSKLRIHTDAKANESARAVNARAYTGGWNIVFGEGQFAPHTHDGRELVAHELTHVAQQQSQGSSFSTIQRSTVPSGGQPGATQPDPIQAEWAAHPTIHGHFANGLATYRDLYPLYVARGVANPAEYLDKNIVQVSFFGHGTPAHTEMSSPLATAEATLRAQGVTPTISSFWAFNPRRIGGTNHLSDHALGRAVDINPSTNPLIKNQDDIRVIKAVTGVDLGTAQTDAAMRKASKNFRETFNQAWIDRKKQELKDTQTLVGTVLGHRRLGAIPGFADQRLPGMAPVPPLADEDMAQVLETNPKSLLSVIPPNYVSDLGELLKSVGKRRTQLDAYAQTGFLNLEQTLIDALTTAGLSWGGRWHNKKDFMHFELPNA